jgi:hypothetical protein
MEARKEQYLPATAEMPGTLAKVMKPNINLSGGHVKSTSSIY